MRIVILLLSILFVNSAQAIDMGNWVNALKATEKNSHEQNRRHVNESYELYFFYLSTCGFCHKIAPLVKTVGEELNIDVKAISADGGPMQGFDNHYTDFDLINSFQIKAYPTVYLIKTDTGDAYPVTQGYIGENGLASRIEAIKARINMEDRNA